MWRIALGILFGWLLLAPSTEAMRLSRPPEFHEWNTNTFAQLNDVLLQLFNLTNGRYQLNVVTSDPDGSRRGNKGEMVLYDNAGTGSLCVNMSSTDWDCTSLAE